MVYKQAKGFFIFWIVSAIAWLMAGFRTYQISDGAQVNWYYFVAAAVSVLIAVCYLKGISKNKM